MCSAEPARASPGTSARIPSSRLDGDDVREALP